MERRKVYLGIILAFLILAFIGKKEVRASEIDCFLYEVLQDDTIEITGYIGDVPEILMIPETIEGKEVTSIGRYAFCDKDSLITIVFPEGIKKIGEYAFEQCHNLVINELPSTVEIIEKGAFAYCSSITSFTIPDKVEVLERGVFGNSVQNLILGKGIKKIATGSLGYAIDEVAINSDIEIFEYQFGCEIKTLRIKRNVTISPEDLIKLGIPVWKEYIVEEGNSKYASVHGVLYTKDMKMLVAYPKRMELEEFVIPDGVEIIGEKSFYQVRVPKSIVIPDSCNYIGKYAFYFVTGLEKINLGNREKRIDDYAFYYAVVQEVTGFENVVSLGTNSFLGCSLLKSKVSLDKCVSIGQGAFKDCSSIPEIILSDFCKSIGKGAISDCDSIEVLRIPDSVTTIGCDAFAFNQNLREVYFGKGVKELSYCLTPYPALQKVYIPKEVTQINRDLIWNYTTNELNLYDLEIWGMTGTSAEKYARERNRPFKKAMEWGKPSAVDEFYVYIQFDRYVGCVWSIHDLENVNYFVLYKDGKRDRTFDKEKREFLIHSEEGLYELCAVNGDGVEGEKISLYVNENASSFITRTQINDSELNIRPNIYKQTSLDIEVSYEIVSESGETRIKNVADDYGLSINNKEFTAGNYDIKLRVSFKDYEITFDVGTVVVRDWFVAPFLDAAVRNCNQGEKIDKGVYINIWTLERKPKKAMVVEKDQGIQIEDVDIWRVDSIYVYVLTKDWKNGNHTVYYILYDENDVIMGCTKTVEIIVKHQDEEEKRPEYNGGNENDNIVLPDPGGDGLLDEQLPQNDKEQNNMDSTIQSPSIEDNEGLSTSLKNFYNRNLIYRVLKINKNKKSGTVTCVGVKKNKKHITIPGQVKYKGYKFKVVQISNTAFRGNGKIKTVVIHDNIKKIGKQAFKNCKNLKKVRIGKNIESVGKQAFFNTNKKLVIEVPKKRYKRYKKILSNKIIGNKTKIKKY